MCFNEVCIEQSARSNITLALCHSLAAVHRNTEIIHSHCIAHTNTMSKLIISNNNFDMVTLALSISIFQRSYSRCEINMQKIQIKLALLCAPCYPEFILLH